MAILVIGESSFLAREVKKLNISNDWEFLGHRDALDAKRWSGSIKTVIGFACDPKVREGEYSDLDHKLARMAKDSGASYVMLSSRAVYGVPPKPVQLTEERTAYASITPYGLAKRKIEDDLLENFDNVTILRLSNIFGFEYIPDRFRQTVFGIMLKTLKEEEKIRFSMNMITQRDFLPVLTFAENLSAIASNPQPGIFNLGAGIGTSVGDMANWVIEGYGKGKVSRSEVEIVDSFILDMIKTRSIYALRAASTEVIKQSCVDIGQALRKI